MGTFFRSDLGYVTETHWPKSPESPIVVYICEAHGHYEAQKHIVGLLEHLIKQHGLKLILVEGSQGDVRLSHFRSYGPPENRREVAEKYLKLGILSAEEYLDVVSDYPLILWGIEKEDLYHQNDQAFEATEALRVHLKPALASVRQSIELLKVRLWEPTLTELEAKTNAFDEGHVSLAGYTDFLAGLVQRLGITEAEYPNFSHLLYMRQLERIIDFANVSPEQQALLEELGQLEAQINISVLIDELERLAKRLRTTLASTSQSQKLVTINEQVKLIEKLLGIQLSPQESQQLDTLPIDGLASDWSSFLNGQLRAHDLASQTFTGLTELEDGLPHAKRCYEIASLRQEAMVTNILGKLDETKERLAVLITGGFHAPRIIQCCKDRRIGLVVLQPKINQPINERLYRAVLKFKRGDASIEEVIAASGDASLKKGMAASQEASNQKSRPQTGPSQSQGEPTQEDRDLVLATPKEKSGPEDFLRTLLQTIAQHVVTPLVLAIDVRTFTESQQFGRELAKQVEWLQEVLGRAWLSLPPETQDVIPNNQFGLRIVLLGNPLEESVRQFLANQFPPHIEIMAPVIVPSEARGEELLRKIDQAVGVPVGHLSAIVSPEAHEINASFQRMERIQLKHFVKETGFFQFTPSKDPTMVADLTGMTRAVIEAITATTREHIQEIAVKHGLETRDGVHVQPEQFRKVGKNEQLYHAALKFKRGEISHEEFMAASQEALNQKSQPRTDSFPNRVELTQEELDRVLATPEMKARLTSRDLTVQADCYREKGRYAEAEPLYLKALAIQEKRLGPENAEVAVTLNHLAMLYSFWGKFTESETLQKRSLAIKEKVLKPEDVSVARSLNNLARLYHDQGRDAEAEPLYQKALAIKEKTLGPKDEGLVITLNGLADLYRSQERYAEAELLYERALAITSNDLDRAWGLNGLAGLRKIQGKPEEAFDLYQRALTIRETNLGPTHPDVARSHHDLAVLYYNQGRYKEAEPLLRRALKIWKETLLPSHPAIAECLTSLGQLSLAILPG